MSANRTAGELADTLVAWVGRLRPDACDQELARRALLDTVSAIALAVPSAGGVQRAFGTMAKPLRVGFASAAEG